MATAMGKETRVVKSVHVAALPTTGATRVSPAACAALPASAHSVTAQNLHGSHMSTVGRAAAPQGVICQIDRALPDLPDLP